MATTPFSQSFTRMLLLIIVLKLSVVFVASGEFDDLFFNFANSVNDSEFYDDDGVDIWTKQHNALLPKRNHHEDEPKEAANTPELSTIVSEVMTPKPGLPAQNPVTFNSDGDGVKRQVHRGSGRGYLLYDTKAQKTVENASTSAPQLNFNEGDSYVDEETVNCTNEYCISDDDYYDMIVQHILPSKSECLLIGLHGVVFFVGLIGNALVCTAVYRNRTMRTVTNYFIVNLAVADFMVILFCLPPTVLWDVTQTWFMGTLLCKIVLYFQTVSVAVSVLTLTFISVDRWYAICFPLKFKSTTGRAKTAIIIIWLLAIGFDIPELLVLETKKFEKFRHMDLIFFTQCSATWSEGTEEMFQLARILLLYTFPLLFMSIAYCQIVKVLWRSDNIPGHSETVLVHGNGAGKRVANNSTECQLRSRRKAAKMLVAVVLMFAVCYFPVHLLNMLRMTMDIKQTEVTGSLAIVSHWLCYANSAVNPVIYNFMSGKFRKEFQRAFGNMCKGKTNEPNTRCRGDSTMVCRYTTMTVGSLTTPKTEIVQLSNTNTVNDNLEQQCASGEAAAAALNRAPRAPNRDDVEKLCEARCSFDLKPPVRCMSEKKQCAPLQSVVIDSA